MVGHGDRAGDVPDEQVTPLLELLPGHLAGVYGDGELWVRSARISRASFGVISMPGYGRSH
jgi:hypothetical protein